METEIAVTVEEAPSWSDIKVLHDGLRQFNAKLVGESEDRRIAIFLRDNEGTIHGGIEGVTSRGWLHISSLFVDQNLRHQGYGSQLLRMAEEEALQRGCHAAFLDTYSFQAPEFYKKHGYEIMGTLEEYPKGFKKHFMYKYLNAADNSLG